MAVTTYPGTVTPLRGLGAFTEAEQDVFWGREDQIVELARLVTGDTYRAGLLHGVAGVGKTSLLRAGLIPHLRDSHGVVALMCRDNTTPATSLAREFSAVTNKAPRENESAVGFLARTVAEAMRGQQFLFILDDIDAALASRDDTVIGELADVFARVVTRSGGRARFLFCCESSEIHTFGILERRTGSLFPPSSRVSLEPFSVEHAATVFERMCTISGLVSDPQVTSYVAQGINLGGPVAPVELQLAALAMRALGATTAPMIEALGGPAALCDAWLAQAAASTGDERTALRLLAQLSQGKGKATLTPQWIAGRSNVDPSFAATALSALRERGVLESTPPDEAGESRYRLAHPILAPRLVALAAPAQAAAKRAFELLGSKAESRGRLSAREWYEVKQQRIEPVNPEERAVLERTRRFAKIALALAVAIPIALLILIYISNSGRYYLDAETIDGSERVVVREGRPGLSMFHWLGFGDVVADTGFDRKMVAEDKWGSIADEDVTFSGGELADESLSILESKRAALISYAIDGSEAALDTIAGNAGNAISGDELADVLDVLAMVARGGAKEVELVEKALDDGSAAVRISALRLAATVEARRPGSYRAQLAAALASEKSQERRLAAAVVRGLPEKLARSLSSAALETATDGEAKAELAARVVTGGGGGPNPSRLATLIASSDTDDTNRAAARKALERLAIAKPVIAVPALGDLAADASAPEADRVWALEVLFDHAVVESEGDLQSKLRPLGAAKSAAIKAAVLPLLARLDPKAAAEELAIMLSSDATPPALRAASALAWGEVAASDRTVAQVALEKLVTDRRTDVRAAAARAMGKLGRSTQGALIELIKKEGLSVATGAAFGLAESAKNGGRVGTAVGGIFALWKRKGRSKQVAAQAYAALARSKPDSVASYIAAAARDKDDSKLHLIGVEGLCNALAAGGRRATRDLLSIARASESTELRRRIADCADDHRDTHPADAIRIAELLLGDSDGAVRLQSVQTLAALAGDDEAKSAVASKLGVALGDPSRAVRIVAAEAIAELGGAAPADIGDKLPAIFSRAAELEKLALLRAGAAVAATSLVPLALADSSDRVRSAGLRLALSQRDGADAALQSALTDPSPDVRRRALEALAEARAGLRIDVVLRALVLASRDSSREIADSAIDLLARAGDPGEIAKRLTALLQSRSDADRRSAAVAARGFAEQDAKQAAALLEEALRDSSRDVRAAAAISLGFALARMHSIEELGAELGKCERAPARRLAVATALALEARDDRDAAIAALEALGSKGPQLARVAARITHGLVSSNSDVLGFLEYLAP